jgi:hypothetical protein
MRGTWSGSITRERLNSEAADLLDYQAAEE